MKPTEMAQGGDELWACANTAKELQDLQTNGIVEQMYFRVRHHKSN